MKHQKKIKALLRRLWIIFVCVVIGVPLYILSVKVNLFNLYGPLPPLQVLENPESALSSELYAADGALLGRYFKHNRSPVEYAQLSPHVVNALLSTEDCRFEQHAGIDLKSLLRAFFLSVVLHQHKGGGSTLTQQLAKNLFNTRTDLQKGLLSKLPFVRTLVAKTKEWIVAVQLERAYTKKEIISMYLNTVTFVGDTFGIKVAAKTFFGASPDALTADQAALLIGLLKAPSRYSPLRYPEQALRRRNVVLQQMYKNNTLSAEEYTQLIRKPLDVQYTVENHHSGLAPYFRNMVRNYLAQWAEAHGYDLFSDGLRIYTTIDSHLQQYAEEAMQEHMAFLQKAFNEQWRGQNPWVDQKGQEIKNFIQTAAKSTSLYQDLKREYGNEDPALLQLIMNTPRPTKLFSWKGEIEATLSPMEEIKYHKRFLHAGILAIEPHTGHIKVWVGGINYKFFQHDHVFQSRRQPGSAFKTIVYVAAIDNGFSPNDLVEDVPVTFQLGGNRTWTPQNWNKKYTGATMTLRQALGRSVNTVSAFLMKKLGPKLVIDYAKRLGIESHLNPVPSVCLGSGEVTLYELLGAYNTFVNHGIWIKPIYITRIEDKNGNVLEEFLPQKREAISEETAYTMIHMLRASVEERGGTSQGIHQSLRAGNEIAGKTGTTSHHSDGWFIGLTHNLVSGVWVGGEDPCIHFKDMAHGAGGKSARPIWEKFMLKVYANRSKLYPKGAFPKPSSLSENAEALDDSSEPNIDGTVPDEESAMEQDQSSDESLSEEDED